MVWDTIWLTMLSLNSASWSSIFFAVSAGSEGISMAVGMYIMPKAPVNASAK
jgi:hypothetical protein